MNSSAQSAGKLGKKVKTGDDIQKLFNIDSINSGLVKITTYKIIKITKRKDISAPVSHADVSGDEDLTKRPSPINLTLNLQLRDSSMTINDNSSKAFLNNNIYIKELKTFEGPF